MDGSQVLGVGLAALTQALKGRRQALLEELRQVERDLETVENTVRVADRMGFGDLDPSVRPPPDPDAVPQQHRIPIAGPTRSVSDDVRLRVASLDAFGPVRNDKDIPSKLDETGRMHDVGPLEANLFVLRSTQASVQGIVERARELPPGPGSRRHAAATGIQPGEPIMPTIRRILDTADRPIDTAEITAVFLRMREVDLVGRDLGALKNRISSQLSSAAERGRVRRIRKEDGRQFLWMRGSS